jgi:hypothetical protein
MIKSIDLQTASYDLEEVAQTVEKDKDQILLRRGDRLVAVVIPASEDSPMPEEKLKARQRFFEIVETIHQRTETLDKKKLQRVVRQGIKEVRERKRQHRQGAAP